nr:hypothetical protein [Bacteroidales bacterium]
MKRLFTSLMVLTAMLCSITTQAAEYDLSVGGVTVTDANKSDIKPSGLTAGKISFSSNTLTFDNVTMKVTGQYLIYNKGIEGLKVVIKGTNKL